MRNYIITLGILFSISISGQTVLKSMLLLPDTGQIISYTSTIGEDNDYLINAPSFTNNGNGTITDNITSLMWQQADGGEMTIENAITYCDNLVLGGFSDWRLPTKQESMSILNLDKNNPALNTVYFPNTNAEYWWTSTVNYSNANSIWITNSGGGTGPKLKTETISAGGVKKFHPRAVRNVTTPTIVTHFTDNGNGTITDNGTNLVWQKAPNATTYTWDQALMYAENLALAGNSDWRLPNLKELVSVNDETTNAPSINTAYFPAVQSARYWSSTTQFAPGGTSAWFNDFQNFGITSYDLKTISHNVICVRGIPSSLAVNEFLNLSSSKNVFPNPFSSKISVLSASGNEYYELYDSLGKQQYAGKNIEKQDFSILSKGIYILKIIDVKTTTLKLVKE